MMNKPTLAGFIQFAQDHGATPDVIDPTSVWFYRAYQVALVWMDRDICALSPLLYELAIYNLAMSNLLTFTPDGLGTNPESTYFQGWRTTCKLLSAPTGFIQSTSDESTSTSFVVPDWAKTMTMQDLQLSKTPFGRQVMAWVQDLGMPWGMS